MTELKNYSDFPAMQMQKQYIEGNISIFIDTTSPDTDITIPPSRNEWADLRLIDQLVNGYISVVVIALGLVCNSLTVIVLTRKTMHSSTNCYLLALTIWDVMVLIGTLMLMTLPELSEYFKDYIFPYVVVYVYPFALTAHMSTLWLTVSFTVERYIAVCHPLQAARMCTINRARIVIVIVSIVSFLFNLCRWFEYRLHFDDSTNGSRSITYMKTDFGENPQYHQVYFLWLYLFIMFFIPLSSLAVLNVYLILAVRRSQTERKNMNVRQSRENNVTIMLISVIIVFIICQFPALVYNLTWAIKNDIVINTYGWRILSTFRNFMVTLNSCVNFILYCAFGQKFRMTFTRTFCTWTATSNGRNSFVKNNFPTTDSAALQTSKYRILRQKNSILTFRMDNLSGTSSSLTRMTSIRMTPNSSRDASPVQGIKTKEMHVDNVIGNKITSSSKDISSDDENGENQHMLKGN